MLLLRRGDNAMISDAAAIPTLIIATVAGSMKLQKIYLHIRGLALRHVSVFRGRQAFLYDRCGVR